MSSPNQPSETSAAAQPDLAGQTGRDSGEAHVPPSRWSGTVVQLADLATLWVTTLSDVAATQADRMSAGDYGLDDLVAGHVGVCRSYLRALTETALTVSSVAGELAYAGPTESVTPRTVRVRVPGTHTADELTISDLVHTVSRFTIPASVTDHRICPTPANAESDVTTVAVTASTPAPNGVYRGTIKAGADSCSFVIALSEVGKPLR